MIERCEANATPETYDLFRAADGRFHVLLAHVARSSRLVAGVTEVRAEVANLLDSVPRQPEALVGSTTHHRRVLAAIAVGDGEGARLAMREHLDATERLLLGVLPSVYEDGSLLEERVGVVVVAVALPEPGLVDGRELETAQPLGRLPEVALRDDQPQRIAVLEDQRLAVGLVGQQDVVVVPSRRAGGSRCTPARRG